MNTTAYTDQLALIVHDLKSPLSTIALEVDRMDARTPSCESIGRIRRNVTFLDRLIYNLLDSCNLANGPNALRRTTCDLSVLLADAIERLVPAGDRSRVVRVAENNVMASVDQLRIERVIANLLDNAFKYTPAGTGIVVRLATEAEHALISVADRGPGVAPDEAELVFEPYRRGASGRTRQGLGLGLYVAKQIVEAHGGWIGVESDATRGTRFFFALPLA